MQTSFITSNHAIINGPYSRINMQIIDPKSAIANDIRVILVGTPINKKAQNYLGVSKVYTTVSW